MNATIFIVSERRRAVRLKRKPEGGVRPLDAGGEGVPADAGLAPEAAYDRAWARAVLDAALRDVAEELKTRGKGAHFEAFLRRVEEEESWESLAGRFGGSPESVRKWVERVEQRVARRLRQEVGATVGGLEEIDPELQALADALAGADP